MPKATNQPSTSKRGRNRNTRTVANQGSVRAANSVLERSVVIPRRLQKLRVKLKDGSNELYVDLINPLLTVSK